MFDLSTITAKQLEQGRRFFIVGAFVTAAVLTPPDVARQLALAIPLLLLHEAAIWWLRRSERAR